MKLTFLLALSVAGFVLVAPPVARAAERRNAAVGQAPAVKGELQIVEFAITEQGAQPAAVTLKLGQPVRLIVRRKTASTCVKQVANKDLGIDRPLPLNEPVMVDVTPAKAGTYKLLCGMGMEFATLKVQ